MLGMSELKARRDLVENIDWDMTPEKAVETYLEWGAGWARRGEAATVPGQETLYFVVYDWENPPQVTLLRRSSQDVEELAKIPARLELVRSAVDQGGRKPGVGVYAITKELEAWLREQLGT